MKKLVVYFYAVLGLFLAWPVKLYQYAEEELDWEDIIPVIITSILQFIWIIFLLLGILSWVMSK